MPRYRFGVRACPVWMVIGFSIAYRRCTVILPSTGKSYFSFRSRASSEHVFKMNMTWRGEFGLFLQPATSPQEWLVSIGWLPSEWNGHWSFGLLCGRIPVGAVRDVPKQHNYLYMYVAVQYSTREIVYQPNTWEPNLVRRTGWPVVWVCHLYQFYH